MNLRAGTEWLDTARTAGIEAVELADDAGPRPPEVGAEGPEPLLEHGRREAVLVEAGIGMVVEDRSSRFCGDIVRMSSEAENIRVNSGIVRDVLATVDQARARVGNDRLHHPRQG